MKKLVCLVLAVMMLLAVAVSANAESEWKFERKISIVCPWGVGGGADSTIRPMAQLLQEILGVPVEVVNVEGGSGVNGVEYTYKQPADGYTFMLGTQSLFMSDMQSGLSMDFKTEFQCMDILVHSINIIAASKVKMEQYGVTNWQELTDYVTAHPWEVSVGMLTAAGVDGASLLEAIGDMQLLQTPYSGGSEINSAMVGGHCDLCITGTDEVRGLVESGDIIPILSLSEERMSIFPDIQCAGELGIDSFMGPWRAIFCKAGTPQGAIDAMIAAIEQAKQDESWLEFTHNAAYDEREVPAPGEETAAFVESEWKALRDFLQGQGTLTKDYPELQ